MTGKWLVIGLAGALALLALSAWSDIRPWLRRSSGAVNTSVVEPYGRATVTFAEASLETLVPQTPDLQAKGLAGRTDLGNDEGMLWNYPQPDHYAFWMKGMTIPIDIIWIQSGQVVDIHANVPPPPTADAELLIYRPAVAASQVLEVRAGFAADHAIQIGDMVDIVLR